jgi:hypothetical protein
MLARVLPGVQPPPAGTGGMLMGPLAAPTLAALLPSLLQAVLTLVAC